MLKTGAQHLESLRDGRVVYIGGERVADVTTHPAFRHAAQTFASLYDAKMAPENRDILSFEEDGERYSAYFLPARSREDLAFRTAAHRKIADLTYGMFGRSPDHVSSFVTGMTTKPEVFGKYSSNIQAYHRFLKHTDAYAVYAIIAPQAAQQPDFYRDKQLPLPTLQVVREDADGVVISGLKMLATGAVFANEIWIGNIMPLKPDQAAQSITCAIPCNMPGLSLWSRKPFARDAADEFDNPLSYRFDESDSMVLCDEVKVPWHRVFVHNDPTAARNIYVGTAGHCYGNHQSNVRFWAKMQLLVGLASKIANSVSLDQSPKVRETLGRLAALEATLGGMIMGQIQGAEDWPHGYVTYNRRFMYAALNWCTENYASIIDTVRELCGGSVFQMPADVSIFSDPVLRKTFEDYWTTPQSSAADRMKLFKLAWELVGSEFAGRHQQYEKFYAGAPFVVRNYNFMHAPWDQFHGVVDGLLGSYDIPEAPPGAGRN
jgi:4-hydroxyphenylacetate 3-monooxygenase